MILAKIFKTCPELNTLLGAASQGRGMGAEQLKHLATAVAMKFGDGVKAHSSHPPSSCAHIRVTHGLSCLPRSAHSSRCPPPQTSHLWLCPTPHPGWAASVGVPSLRCLGGRPTHCTPLCYGTSSGYESMPSSGLDLEAAATGCKVK